MTRAGTLFGLRDHRLLPTSGTGTVSPALASKMKPPTTPAEVSNTVMVGGSILRVRSAVARTVRRL